MQRRERNRATMHTIISCMNHNFHITAHFHFSLEQRKQFFKLVYIYSKSIKCLHSRCFFVLRRRQTDEHYVTFSKEKVPIKLPYKTIVYRKSMKSFFINIEKTKFCKSIDFLRYRCFFVLRKRRITKQYVTFDIKKFVSQSLSNL